MTNYRSVRPNYARNAELTNLTHRHRPDYVLLVLMVLLIVIGLVVIYSISPALGLANNVSDNFYISRQLIAVGLGTLVFIVASRLPLAIWKRWAIPLLAFAALATLVAIVMPANPHYPAHRWVRLGSLSFQSVELLKFAILVWLAALLDRRIRERVIKNSKKTFRPLLISIVLIGLVVAGVQSDLGSTGVIVVMMGSLAFIAGMPVKRLSIVLAIIAVGVLLATLAIPYRRERLMTYLHPDSNCQTASGYQACQALISVGSGGMFGLGLGQSVQAYGYLPEAANDSIFAIYAEKFGFIGVIVLFGLLAAMFSRLKNISERAPDNFSRLLVLGVLVWLSVQALVNIGAMIGLLPLKGITLPLISYGGTSIVFVMAAMGIVFNVSRFTTYGRVQINGGDEYENRLSGRRNGRAYYANSRSRART